MPKRISLISLVVVCSLWNVAPPVYAQALIPHTLQLDRTALEKQGLALAQEALQLAQFQQFELALPRAELASQLAPNNGQVWILLGTLYMQSKDFNKATTALQKAKTLEPKNPNVFFALGSVNFQQQKYQAAAESIQAGLRFKPNDPEGLFDLGNALYMLSRYSEAIAQYNKAVSQRKEFWPAINNIGLIKYEQGDISGAMKQWRSAIDTAQAAKEPAAEPQLALAVAMYIKGDKQQALTMGETALRTDSRYANIDFLKDNLWGNRLLNDTKKFLSQPRMQAAAQERKAEPRRPSRVVPR